MKGKRNIPDWVKITLSVLILLGLGLYNWQIYFFNAEFGFWMIVVDLFLIGTVILMLRTIRDRWRIKAYWLGLCVNIFIAIGAIYSTVFGDLDHRCWAFLIFAVNFMLCISFIIWIYDIKERITKKTKVDLGEWAGRLLDWIRFMDKTWEDRDDASVLRNLTHCIQKAAALITDQQFLPEGSKQHVQTILLGLRGAHKLHFSTTGKQSNTLAILKDLEGPLGMLLKIAPFDGEMLSDSFQPKPAPDAPDA